MYESHKAKKRRKMKQQIILGYVSKPKMLNWHDAYAKAVFDRKPYYMEKKERMDDERS